MSEVDSTEELAPADDVAASPRPRRRRAVIEWAVILVIAVVASFLLRTYVLQTFSIPSKSMLPTLAVGDHILVDKLSVEFGTINVGDVIVFKAPPQVKADCADAVTDLVKRVIGVPGDRLSSKGNTIYVDAKPLNENWSHWEPLGTGIGPLTVPAGEYAVMGDNHANSCDSRTWGFVPRSDVIGKVFMRIWPPSRITWF